MNGREKPGLSQDWLDVGDILTRCIAGVLGEEFEELEEGEKGFPLGFLCFLFFLLGSVGLVGSVGGSGKVDEGGPSNFCDSLIPAILWVSKCWYRSWTTVALK